MTRGTASLGMYDHPAQHVANDRLWTAIARALRRANVPNVPDELDRSRNVEAIWRDPGLLFGQACGYPMLADPTLNLRMLALPIYAIPGYGNAAAQGSVLIARAESGHQPLEAFRGCRAAINDPRSNTGMNLFRAALAPVAAQGRVGGQGRAGPFFRSVVETGSHRASILAVGTGEADLAAIDCVTYAAIDRFEPALTSRLAIVAHSPVSPSLPFVTSRATDGATVAALRLALDHAIADPDLGDVRDALFLVGVAPAERSSLAPIAALQADAIHAGYPELC
ncbi:phosphate/phosphite/phosphonate ABC transporter substrate-binding protein [Sphingomonas sp. OK281]|uniref:phosphate/phosphite/phosphonate ABC transporter substrate-binding protein n=1 Tax=Sphingomonas sp. OK281 TaxID=1881067 RepID=UPI0008F04FF5|nr:PhnD/SsuA/transferrin family substrate-binding protein [Sphingomonas sp. OK281]SFN81502.1 ABC transporter, phosphonate, substrate-binding protein [Sphingomonas sp. OK281]